MAAADLAEWDILGDKEEYQRWLRQQTGEQAEGPQDAEAQPASQDAAHESESRVLELPEDVQEIIETDPSLAEVLRTTFVQKFLERCCRAASGGSRRSRKCSSVALSRTEGVD